MVIKRVGVVGGGQMGGGVAELTAKAGLPTVEGQVVDAVLLRNDGDRRNNWLLGDTGGMASNRDGSGTRIALSAGGAWQWAEVRAGGSYLGSDDRRVHFGLGAADRIERLELRWPSGAVQVLEDVMVNQVLRVGEPEGK